MINELNQEIEAYRVKWQTLIDERTDKAFFTSQKPTAVGWKVEDVNDLDKKFAELRDLCDQIHFGWINERWLITMHLKSTKLAWGIEVIKLMQRRPQSTDKVGLDHVDFLSESNPKAESVLNSEPNLKWTKESNDYRCKWLSLWFAGTEAKLRTDTVLEVCVKEMQETDKKVKA
ncbi:MAG TPA: hypothetical protein VMR95_03675 [Candidatus Binatia bacterium]|nr:hypothetical protein [Candidatus Binatia bacterium]